MRNFKLLAATAISAALILTAAVPAHAQSSAAAAGDSDTSGDIIVNARRTEEKLQDVPISVTVLSASSLANNNITSAKDIATFTPSLVTNNRFGSDNTTWTIRGFTQEQRTTATVGTFFADVVAPRGSGATQGGDGAGPGSLFDLSSVQVLNGPQGTLFGRNSTGGAVLLVPNKPKDNFEGYIEGSAGDYGMWRAQAVLNAPINENFRIRIGVDRNKRNGYLKNAGKLGFGPYGDAGGSTDYTALRISTVLDVTPDIENYTIGAYSKSKSTGVIPKITRCYSIVVCEQMAREAPLGFWSVSNPLPDSQSVTEQWQIINTTKWEASDSLTIKNIFSYGEFRGTTNLDLFGQYQPLVTPGTETNGSQVRPFVFTHAAPFLQTNAESSLVEELQFQGNLADGKLTWQGGLYFESNKPLGPSGVQTATFTPCIDSTTLNCLGFLPFTVVPGAGGGSISLGRLNYQVTSTSFNGKAAYFQTSYDVTEQLKLTGGIRYTEDRMSSTFQTVDIRLGNPVANSAGVFEPVNFVTCTNTVAFGAQGSLTNPRLPLSQKANICRQGPNVAGAGFVPAVKTSAPTWLLGVDFKPIDNVLLYAKWSRGYRQGGVAPFAADKLQTYGAEKVDTYEGGLKASWRGVVPGFVNFAGFYNNFRDQQLQIGVSCNPTSLCAQTTTILNVGKSRLSGFEAELGLQPFQGLRLSASWAHLKTKIIEVAGTTDAVIAATSIRDSIAALGLPFNDVRPVVPGSVLPNSIPDKVVAQASYTLPLPESFGKFSIGGTWVWQSAYRVVTDSTATVVNGISTVGNGILPKANYGNINVNWEDVGGLPFDIAFFMTNVTNAKILLHANAQEANGLVSNIVGEPRMWGARLKWKFGN